MKSSLFQKTVVLVSASFLIGIATGYVIFENQIPKLPKNVSGNNDVHIDSETDDELDLPILPDIWALLQEKFVEPEKLDIQKLRDSAVKGFVFGIDDPYTTYMNREETKEFHENLNGRLEGIGALLELRNGNLTVVTPLKNSPAATAGIKAADIIEKVNGKLTSKMTLHEAVQKIRGKAGTDVTLTIIREGEEKPLEITITRGPIEIESVTHEEVGENLALISINQFSDDTQNELQEAIQKILLKKPGGLILDLRFNGGGYLDISIEIVSEFLAGKVTAVKIKRKNPEENEILKTSGNARLTDIPMAVLVNKGSASASEIVAGALQDYKRAAIIGEKTFGKGSVQEISALKDGSSLRLTVAKWLTPLDRDIDAVGIAPDIEVPFPEDTPEGQDPQLEEAVRYLEVGNPVF